MCCTEKSTSMTVSRSADNVIKEERHSDTARQSLTQRETVLRDSLADLVRSTGIEVIEDVLEGQHVLGMANGHAQLMSFESRMTMRNILLDALNPVYPIRRLAWLLLLLIMVSQIIKKRKHGQKRMW